MNRRMIPVFLIITAMALLFAADVIAEEILDESGQWWYELTESGATIAGFYDDDVSGHLVIPDTVDGHPVTAISDGAFYWRGSLTGVTIPESVTRIGVEAFYWCESLTSVIIPDSVTGIGDWAFKECFSLENVTIGSGVTSIGEIAFFGCESLTHVNIPDNVTSIGDYAFAHCSSLISVTIPASVTDMGERVFFDCEELTLYVPEDSYAEQYAKENGLRFTTDEMCTQPDTLTDLTILEDWDTGMVLGAALTSDGMLLAGVAEYYWAGTDGWLSFIDKEGNESWSLGEGDVLFLRPIPLANGGFAVLCRRGLDGEFDDESQTVSLMILNQDGTVMANQPVPRYARDIVAVEDSIFVLGNQEAEDGDGESAIGESFLARFTSDGEPLWAQSYSHPEYEELRFQKAIYAEESLIIGANADVAESGLGICVLYRYDLDGNFIWAAEHTPEIGDDCFIIDVCVNDDGIIAMACGEYAYDEEYGEPLSRMCDVFGRYMDGDVLWNCKRNGAMVDYIVPVQGGFLCVSQGLDLYNCPYIGDGWALLLDENGNVKAKDSTPDIGGGRYEIYGMTKGVSGEAFLYGTLLDDPGFPGVPFVGRLVFPEAYD